MNPENPQQAEPEAQPFEPAPVLGPAVAEEPLFLGRDTPTDTEAEPFMGDEAGDAPAEEGDAAEAPRAPAGEPSAAARPQDRRKLYAAVAAGAAVLLLLFGFAFLWRTHSEIGLVRRELDALKAHAQRAQVQQERAAILRVRAELQALRQTVPADLAAEVDKADAALTAVDDRLKASQ